MTTPYFCSTCGATTTREEESCPLCPHTRDLSPAPSETACLLHQRYRLLAQLGMGGYSTVYQALDTQSRQVVAIKQIRLSGLSASESIEATETFYREGTLLSHLSHPRLPRLFDQFSDREHWYLVMDYIHGQTLDAYLHEQESLATGLLLSEVLEMALQLCDILDYLHTRQPPVIFRDLKPENIMREDTGQLKLIDFGIARRLKSEQRRDTIPLGSPGYAAPEQYGKAQTTPQADIYSLGMLLYRMLSGHDPAEESLQPLKLPEIQAEALVALVERMCSLDVMQRPGNVKAVAKELLRLQQLQPETEQQPIEMAGASSALRPVAAPAAKPGQQLMQPRIITRRTLITGVLTGGLVLLGGSVLWQANQRRGSPSAQGPLAGWDPQWDSTSWSPTFNWVISGYSQPLEDNTSPESTSLDTSFQLAVFTGQGQQLLATFQPAKNTNIFYSPSIFWSPSGKQVLIIEENQGGETLWQIPEGEQSGPLEARDGYYSWVSAWSPDSTRLVGTLSPLSNSQEPDILLAIWHASDGRLLSAHPSHLKAIMGLLAWSPDGQQLAGIGEWGQQLAIWHAADGALLSTHTFPGEIAGFTWSPSGKYIALTMGNSSSWGEKEDGYLIIWEVSTNRAIREIRASIGADVFSLRSPIWSPDGAFLVFTDGGTPCVLKASGSGDFFYAGTDTTYAFAWSPDGKFLALARAGALNEVEVWRVADRTLVGKFPFQYDFSDLQRFGWSADGRRINAGSKHRQIQSWQVR